MKEIIGKIAGRYDRSIVALAIGLALIFTFYFRMSDMIDRLLYNSPVIQELKTVNSIRQVKEETMMKEITDIKDDIRSILQELRKK